MSQRIANTEIAITSSRPVARGRDLFGALVLYEQIWNPGADQATAMALTRDVQIDRQRLKSGKYSLWTIPRQERWTIIFSRAAEVYHTPYPGANQDALRIQVSRFEDSQFLEPPHVSRLAGERRAEERDDEIPGDFEADDTRAKHDHVHVIVLDALAGRVRVVTEAAADSGDLVHCDRRPNPAAAEQHAPQDIGRGHGMADCLA